MAARFPQSTSAISGKRIPTALVSAGVKAVVWAASANSVHVLLAGQTVTTLLTRAAGGATFNSTDGRITGTVSGSGTSQYFALSVSGGIGVTEQDYTQIVSMYGEVGFGAGWGSHWLIGSDDPLGIFQNFEGLLATGYGIALHYKSNDMGGIPGGDWGDGTRDFMVVGIRSNQSDATARNRCWANGAEVTTRRNNSANAGTTAIGSTAGRPIYFGGTNTDASPGDTNTNALEFEAILVGTGAIPDATLDALTAKAGPTTWIEDAPSAPTLSGPTGTATGPTQATIGVTSDTAPTTTAISYQILPAATAAPSAATIVGAPDGTISTGSAGALTKAITGLTTNTAVKVHFAQGASSNVVSSASFTPNTLAIAGTALSAQSGTQGSAFSWSGSTPDSLISNHGNGAGSWSGSGLSGSGLSVNSSTGVLSGTCGAPAVYSATLTYTDSSTVPAAQTVSKAVTVTITALGGGGVTFAGTVPPKTGSAGSAFDFGSPALDSYFTGAGTYAAQSGSLGSIGLSIDANTGVISGATPIAGTQSVVIRKTAASGSPATADTNSFQITIEAAAVSDSGTILLPPVGDLRDGQEITIFSSLAVTALTVSGNGASVNGAPLALAANGYFRLKFNASSLAWYRIG